jgi:hypothetical protein
MERSAQNHYGINHLNGQFAKCFDATGPGRNIIVDHFIIRNSKSAILSEQGNFLNGCFFSAFKFEGNHGIASHILVDSQFKWHFCLGGGDRSDPNSRKVLGKELQWQ